jgi:hypothetical protein
LPIVTVGSVRPVRDEVVRLRRDLSRVLDGNSSSPMRRRPCRAAGGYQQDNKVLVSRQSPVILPRSQSMLFATVVQRPKGRQ